jgi:hypothetical protein
MFSPDGARLLIDTGGEGPIIRDFKPNNQPIAALVSQAEVLTGRRLDPAAGMVRLDAATLAELWKQISSKSR